MKAPAETARDLSGLRYHGAIVGRPAWRNDAGKHFLRFEGGGDDRVQVDGLPVITGSFTIAVWARSATTNFTGGGVLASRPPTFALLPLDGSRQVKFVVNTISSAQRELTFDLGEISGFEPTDWHHYAASYDAATGALRLHVDGIGRASVVHPPEAPMSAAGALFLGSHTGTASFAGDLSDVRLHPLALTPQRIANTASSRLDDADGDGWLSDWEHRNGLDPFNPADATIDSDGDGLPDSHELWIIGLSPDFETLAEVNPGDDPDGDGASNYQEWLAGTRPLDPNDVFRIVSWEIIPSVDSRDIRVTIDGRSGRGYSLLASETLAEPWNAVASIGPLASDQPVVLEWKDIPEHRGFVRVRVDSTPAAPIPD